MWYFGNYSFLEQASRKIEFPFWGGGTGYYSNGVEYDTDKPAIPSEICMVEGKLTDPPEWATYVVWFNR